MIKKIQNIASILGAVYIGRKLYLEITAKPAQPQGQASEPTKPNVFDDAINQMKNFMQENAPELEEMIYERYDELRKRLGYAIGERIDEGRFMRFLDEYGFTQEQKDRASEILQRVQTEKRI